MCIPSSYIVVLKVPTWKKYKDIYTIYDEHDLAKAKVYENTKTKRNQNRHLIEIRARNVCDKNQIWKSVERSNMFIDNPGIMFYTYSSTSLCSPRNAPWSIEDILLDASDLYRK